MNDTIIVTSYVVIDDRLKAWAIPQHSLQQMSDAEIITVAMVAALYFHNHHERALWVLYHSGYLSQALSTSRFNRRLHRLAEVLYAVLDILADLWRQGEVFILDSLPLPVCRRIRARRCRKVHGSAYYSRCPAKDERFFGWRLHLICSGDGLPVAFELLPARAHDLNAIHDLTASLSSGARVFADKGYNSAADEAALWQALGVRLIPKRKKNMQPHSWADDYDLHLYRQRIETVGSQLVNMGLQQLHARTAAGFALKVLASLLALTFSNLH